MKQMIFKRGDIGDLLTFPHPTASTWEHFCGIETILLAHDASDETPGMNVPIHMALNQRSLLSHASDG